MKWQILLDKTREMKYNIFIYYVDRRYTMAEINKRKRPAFHKKSINLYGGNFMDIKKLFANEKEHRSLPFWSWNDRL